MGNRCRRLPRDCASGNGGQATRWGSCLFRSVILCSSAQAGDCCRRAGPFSFDSLLKKSRYYKARPPHRRQPLPQSLRSRQRPLQVRAYSPSECKLISDVRYLSIFFIVFISKHILFPEENFIKVLLVCGGIKPRQEMHEIAGGSEDQREMVLRGTLVQGFEPGERYWI